MDMTKQITEEKPMPEAIAPPLGISPLSCRRCFIGRDDDHDGNCATCAKLDYAGALELRLIAIALNMREGKLGRVQALLDFCLLTLGNRW